MEIRRLDSTKKNFSLDFQKFMKTESETDSKIEDVVSEIIQDVRREGDKALRKHTIMLDKLGSELPDNFELSRQELEKYYKNIQLEERVALESAAERIESFHKKQIVQSWSFSEPDGTVLGQKITPIDTIGLYVPGGKAAYPSSVLMNAIPAKVAGVRQLVMVVPTPGGRRNEMVLAAAVISGVDRVFTIGGAQAIAALAFGTKTVPKVDKIVGPGNAFVTMAKRKVFGYVGIDMIAGPSEILVVADQTANPDWVSMDLFSQAEHDEMAQPILISWDQNLLDAVYRSMQELIKEMPRAKVIKVALENRGAFIKVRTKEEAADLINQIAPEHLEIVTTKPRELLDQVKNAGAVFLGTYSSEALGDYCAGPNHVLPTNGTSRFSSPLGVYDFQKRTSIMEVSQEGAKKMGRIAGVLARGEGLFAHARSALMRNEENE